MVGEVSLRPRGRGRVLRSELGDHEGGGVFGEVSLGITREGVWSNRKSMPSMDRFYFQIFPILQIIGPIENRCLIWSKFRKNRGPQRRQIFYRT